MKDTYRHKGLRRRLVNRLRKKGIKDERVLEAMDTLPRHFFLDDAFSDWAYRDQAFPIGSDQTISQPYTVAFMTEHLKVERRQKILEIGTGSGYQAVLLAMLGARVFTVERQADLFHQTTQRLRELGFVQVRTFLRDGSRGLPEYAPFDRILVTAGAPEVPEVLLEQLAFGGIMLIPVGRTQQSMMRITRRLAGDYQYEDLGSFKFVPFLPGINPGAKGQKDP